MNEHLEHLEHLHETKDLATQPPWANTQSSPRDPRQAGVGWSCWEQHCVLGYFQPEQRPKLAKQRGGVIPF